MPTVGQAPPMHACAPLNLCIAVPGLLHLHPPSEPCPALPYLAAVAVVALLDPIIVAAVARLHHPPPPPRRSCCASGTVWWLRVPRWRTGWPLRCSRCGKKGERGGGVSGGGVRAFGWVWVWICPGHRTVPLAGKGVKRGRRGRMCAYSYADTPPAPLQHMRARTCNSLSQWAGAARPRGMAGHMARCDCSRPSHCTRPTAGHMA